MLRAVLSTDETTAATCAPASVIKTARLMARIIPGKSECARCHFAPLRRSADPNRARGCVDKWKELTKTNCHDLVNEMQPKPKSKPRRRRPPRMRWTRRGRRRNSRARTTRLAERRARLVPGRRINRCVKGRYDFAKNLVHSAEQLADADLCPLHAHCVR